MYVKAYAKINISLDVVARREDGFHDMLMVMQRVGIYDDINIGAEPGKSHVAVKTDRPYIPIGDKNIAGRAARLYMEAAGIKDRSVFLSIHKRLPVCAGLGGGSSDAAAVLEGMDAIFEGRLPREELFRVAEELGSDVPFCLHGGTALVSGRGETIERLPDFPHSWAVICKPEFSVSTPELFKRLDECKIILHPDTEGLVAALKEGDLQGICQRCYNVFEDVLTKRHRRLIDGVKDAMVSGGALGAAMSGTGSASFGIFADRGRAEEVFERLKTRYRDSFLVELGKKDTEN